MLSDVEAREALHVLLLKKLSECARPDSYALKGGVNLRLFFGSVRFSEDMDLDVDPRARDSVARCIARALTGEWLDARLRALGLEGLMYSGRPAKSTATTIRFKITVLNRGGVPCHTRIEISLRGKGSSDACATEAVADGLAQRYLPAGEGKLEVAHYRLQPAIQQKIVALALRRAPQARDVFDLYELSNGDAGGVDTRLLGRMVARAHLEVARERAWELGHRHFVDQVLEFLPPAQREALSAPEQWEIRQLFAVELVEATLAQLDGTAGGAVP